jgi:glycosyltransferase involved in cell wall biosynthesis
VSEAHEDPPPLVSVVIPMLNERGRIQHCLDGLEAQAYPIDRIEALVVDGGSTDGSTELVHALQADRPWLRLVHNPDRRASSAFNRGVEAAKGDVIVLLSSHGEVGTDFISRSVDALEETGAGGVGGVLRHEGDDAVSRAIGLAMTSPFGMASPFRYATTRRVVDTIGHPAYRREVLDEVGPFDEGLERNSDYELNYRIRKAGYELVFDPDIVTVYRPRSTLRELARQFWWYGRWKAHVVRRQPGSLQPRHLAPPAFVALAATAPVLARFPAGRFAVAAASVTYAGGLAAAVRAARPRHHEASTAVFVAALPVMHVSWGAGFAATALAGWRR